MAVRSTPAAAAGLPQQPARPLSAARPACRPVQALSMSSVRHIAGALLRKGNGSTSAVRQRCRHERLFFVGLDCKHCTDCAPLTGSSSSLFCGSDRRQQRQQQRRQQLAVSARARDPDALDDSGDDPEAANREPPSLFWRCFSALCYLVPWIDSISLGGIMYTKFRNLLLLYFVPGAFMEGDRIRRERLRGRAGRSGAEGKPHRWWPGRQQH